MFLFFLAPIVIFIISVLIVICIVKSQQKKIKNGDASVEPNSNFNIFESLQQMATKMNEAVEEANTVKCRYCGSRVERGVNKCPNCSAAITGDEE